MRGGSSKPVVFSKTDLPNGRHDLDELLLGAFGSPDTRQVDGLGGADPLTSKVAIVAASQDDDIDVVYTFGQVGIAEPTINYGVACGNTAAAVALYAVQEGLVAAQPDRNYVRIFCVNNNRRIDAEVLDTSGQAEMVSEAEGDGLPATGAEVRLRFLSPAGGVTGQLLPTGAAVNAIRVPGRKSIRFSLVDCGNLYAITPAADLSLIGNESPHEIDQMPAVTTQVEQLREAIADRFLRGQVPGSDRKNSARKIKIAIVGPVQSTSEGSADVVARIINQERTHKAFAVTGAVCFAAAASIPGTVVNELYANRGAGPAAFRIGHPQGVIEALAQTSDGEGFPVIESVQVRRTARRIMDGYVYVPSKKTNDEKQ